MKVRAAVLVFLALALPLHVTADEPSGYYLVEDYGDEADPGIGMLSYYYHVPVIPGPNAYSYYFPWPDWGDPELPRGYVIGQFFKLGDVSTGTGPPADPVACHLLEGFRILDFAGYSCEYPRWWDYFTVEYDVYCVDEYGCPIGPSLWNSGRFENCHGWNLVDIDPPLNICVCSTVGGPPPSEPRILITATHVGDYTYYPQWGFDYVSKDYLSGLEMHDEGCLPALFPRPFNSHYPTMHSGYYGPGMSYCPPLWIRDRGDSTPDATQYGYAELAWRIYLYCTGPSETKATTWGSIKSMYR